MILHRLKELRARALMTQGDLAEMSGVSRQTIGALEKGSSARISTARNLAEALKVQPKFLVAPLRHPRLEALPLDQAIREVMKRFDEGWQTMAAYPDRAGRVILPFVHGVIAMSDVRVVVEALEARPEVSGATYHGDVTDGRAAFGRPYPGIIVDCRPYADVQRGAA